MEEKLVDETLADETAKAEAECAEKSEKKKKRDVKAELEAEIEALKLEIKEKDDKYLRMAAEYDNFRRRSREEHTACYENALADTVAELLSVVDNLERATLYDDGEKVKEGLVMIEKSVKASFEKLGVTEIGKVGEQFDPQLHNAVMHVEDENFGEGEIVEVFQKGYKKGNKIIRFAMVKTAN
jgi:molecular chaperone GrpE